MRAVAAMAVAMALTLAACSEGPDASVSGGVPEGTLDVIQVGTSDTLAPSVSWPDGAVFDQQQTEVAWEGNGAPLQDGQSLLLDIYVQSLETGAVLQNTYDGLPEPTLLAPETIGDDLYQTLLGLNVGARVITISPRVDEGQGEPAIVAIVDVISDRAVGPQEELPAGLPGVTSASDGQPLISLDAMSDLPTELTVATVIAGDGAQVQTGSFISAQFTAVYTSAGGKDDVTWSAGDVQQTTWSVSQAPLEVQIGVGKAIKAFDEGLLDQTVGSRVLIVAPEAWAYPGLGTLVYVVDILDVWTPPELGS